MLTAKQIDLVQDSFARILPATAAAADGFYGRLFSRAPYTRALFANDMADQGRKLFLTLATVVDSLDDLADVVPVAEALAVRHVGYGVRDEHYAIVGECLIDTLRAALGPVFDAETAAAWADAYAILSDCMRAAALRAIAAAPEGPHARPWAAHA